MNSKDKQLDCCYLYVYRELQRTEVDEDDEHYEDMKFSGGLCIPGKIWHRLYKYVIDRVCWAVACQVYVLLYHG